MDDLLGEDWQKPSKPTAPSNNPPLNANTFASNISSFRASPALSQSGTASPNISRPSSTLNGGAKPPASSGDQFGNLLSLKSQKATANNVSIQERQKQLLEEKRRQQEQQATMWDTLGSGKGTLESRGPSPNVGRGAFEDEDDIMAAFNKDAPVDNASYFPPPTSEGASGRNTPAQHQPSAVGQSSAPSGGFDDDDDPFGLGSLPRQINGHAAPQTSAPTAEDDDILGDLGKPVSERPRPPPAKQAVPAPERDLPAEEDVSDIPQDRNLAELVEMGFPVDSAKIALAESGGNVQGAVGWLLQQAHEDSRRKAQAGNDERRERPVGGSRSPQRRPRGDQDAMPAWMRQESRSGSAVSRQDSRSPAGLDKDAAQIAQEYGNKLFKGATSLWKASQKQMAKTMAEFQQERDPSQPKWMQDASADSSRSNSQRRADSGSQSASVRREPDVTNEAALLDMPRERPQKPSRQTSERADEIPPRQRVPAEPLPQRPAAQPKFMQQAPSAQEKRPITKLSRQAVEEQSAQAYISPARRKKAAPRHELQPEPEVDLFSPAPSKASPAPTPTSRSVPSSAPTRPKAPPRNIPAVSPSALSTSAQHRKAGGEAFKRGDYASAHEAYSAALRPLPSMHPTAIIVYTNRALTGIKTGDAKTAVSDADEALKVIGESQGVGETIELGGGEGTKDMREFFGKALMRKAEALEHMEKWTDAAAVWRSAVGAGVGGAVSLRGRDRCEKAGAPKTAAKPATARSAASGPVKAPPAKSLGNSLQRPTLTNATSAEAVKKLRAANAAAEKADDEKFALVDQVDARLTAWKGGKADNLRALLQSLDGVLWEGAGWKKVGMSDLVMPNKVKIVYMKAIAKVHPDKIPQDATTEQRMVSAAVFSTLNEAWDKFKKDNNL
ncbi:UBA domain-containing 7 [Lecanosticta acicola]|uniref:UBA domain-containing 7 n=1 Tax=Lecanosticta acicola TaxID=111012 RepID=A0AAI9EB03_9PEZI|nr:UBA domain-containing 7 [Lecanosticta acicola]